MKNIRTSYLFPESSRFVGLTELFDALPYIPKIVTLNDAIDAVHREFTDALDDELLTATTLIHVIKAAIDDHDITYLSSDVFKRHCERLQYDASTILQGILKRGWPKKRIPIGVCND